MYYLKVINMIELLAALPYATIGALIRTFYGIWKAFNYDHCMVNRKKILAEFAFSVVFGVFGAIMCTETGYLKFASNIAAVISGLLGANSVDFIVKKVGLGRKLDVNFIEKPEYPELNQRQRRALNYLKEEGKITVKAYQEINGNVGRNTAKWELKRLVDLGYLKKCGKGKATYYILKKAEES
jgi:hypothetical protein